MLDKIGKGIEAVGKAASSRFSAQLIGSHAHTPPSPTTRNAINLYINNPWVHTIINRISEQAAQEDWFVKRGDKKIAEHPVLDFINSGSEYLTGGASRKMAFQHYRLAGEAFIMVGRDGSGKPASWVPIPPHWVTEVAYMPGQFFTIQGQRGGSILQVPAEDILWIKDADPLDPTGRGTSITRAAMTEIALESSTSQFIFNFIKNRARPDLIVTGTADNPMDKDDTGALENLWVSKHGGAQNAGKPLFSRAPLDIKEVGWSLKDSEISKLRAQATDFLFQLYGVPPSLFGRMESTNRSSAETADYTFARYCVYPLLSAFRDFFQSRLMMEFTDLSRLKLGFENPIAENREAQANVMRIAPNAFKRNDFRRLAAMEPLPGPEGEELMEMGNAGTAGSGEGDNAKLTEAQDDAKKKKQIAPPKSKAMEPLPSADVAEAVDVSRSEDIAALSIILGVIGANAARDYAAEVGLGSYNIDGALSELAFKQASDLVQKVNTTTKTAVEAVIVAERSEKRNPSEAIIALFGAYVGTRSMLIAVTAANGILNGVRQEIGKAAGLAMKEWLDSSDERVRNTHAAMSGQLRAINEPFNSPSGDSGQYPGGFSTAAENAGCRCVAHVPPLAKAAGGGLDAAARSKLLADHSAHIDRVAADIESVAARMFKTQERNVLFAAQTLRPKK